MTVYCVVVLALPSYTGRGRLAALVDHLGVVWALLARRGLVEFVRAARSTTTGWPAGT